MFVTLLLVWQTIVPLKTVKLQVTSSHPACAFYPITFDSLRLMKLADHVQVF